MAPAPASEPLIDEGVVGELGPLPALVEELSRSEANEAARGWGGDRYVAWRSGSGTCVRATVVMDTAPDRAQLAAALARWAESRRGARVEGADGAGPIVFTACG